MVIAASWSMSIGVSASRTVVTNDGCVHVAGSVAGTGIAGDAVLGIRVATDDDSSLLAGNGDRDGNTTDIGAIIELDCDEPVEFTSVDSRLLSSSLAKSSSSLVGLVEPCGARHR